MKRREARARGADAVTERAKNLVWWGAVVAYGTFLPYARRFWTVLFGRRSPWFSRTPLILSAILVLVVFWILLRRKERRATVYAAIVVISFLYCYLFRIVTLPIERIHMGEYGILTFFIVMALAGHARGNILYLWAVIMAFHIGIIDELVQGFIAGRYYDLQDVWLNAYACGLGGCVVAFIIRPGRVACER
ncbi:MAG: VanZ family protein [Candidatus Tritonobacter lacicola]|nr:VanZ family protein [Candidatus Tritonobacter lacicola]